MLQEQTIRIEGTRGTKQQELVYKITLLCLSPCISFLFSIFYVNIISRQVAFFLLYLMLSLGRWYLFWMHIPIWRHFVRNAAEKDQLRDRRDRLPHPGAGNAVKSDLCLEVNIPLLRSSLFVLHSSARESAFPPGNGSSLFAIFDHTRWRHVDDI